MKLYGVEENELRREIGSEEGKRRRRSKMTWEIREESKAAKEGRGIGLELEFFSLILGFVGKWFFDLCAIRERERESVRDG